MMQNFLSPILAGVIIVVFLPEFAWFAIGALLGVILVSYLYTWLKGWKNKSFASSGANSHAFIAIAMVCGLCSLSILATKLFLFILG